MLQKEPKQAEALCLLAQAAHRSGKGAWALEILDRSIAADPSSSEARFYRAVLLQDKGRIEEAARGYEEAIRLDPRLAQAHHNLASIHHRRGRLDEAKRSLERAIEIESTSAGAHNNLGNVLRDQGLAQAALACYRKAVELDPSLAFAHTNLGAMLLKLDQAEEALAACRRAIKLDPVSAAAHHGLGLAFERLGRAEEAQESYREALRLKPDAAGIFFDLAASAGGPPPTRAPAEYVASLFDRYAANFDAHLVDRLRYRTPDHLLRAVEAAGLSSDLDVLDLGCGTGLCGQIFRHRARTLTGVDLSAQMVEAARQRGIYDHLAVGEISETLRGRPASFDLILAADVFVYVGDLSGIFADAQRALRPGGLFAFSVEAHDGDGYVLRPTRRYAHSLGQIEDLASKNALLKLRADRAVLRTDDEKDVEGWVLVLKSSG